MNSKGVSQLPNYGNTACLASVRGPISRFGWAAQISEISAGLSNTFLIG